LSKRTAAFKQIPVGLDQIDDQICKQPHSVDATDIGVVEDPHVEPGIHQWLRVDTAQVGVAIRDVAGQQSDA
jgi:hypothetical protein